MAIGPVQDAAARVNGPYVQVQRPVTTVPADARDARAAETEERRARIPSQTGPSRDGREEQIQPGSRVTRNEDGDMAVISPEGVAYVEQAQAQARGTDRTDEEARETAGAVQAAGNAVPQGGPAVQDVGPAARRNDDAVQGVGPVAPQGGPAVPDVGPTAQRNGDAVPGVGTAPQDGNAVQGVGPAAQRNGDAVPGIGNDGQRTGAVPNEEEEERKASTEKLASYSVSKLKRLYQDRAITKTQYDEAMEVKEDRTDKEEEKREEDEDDQIRTRMRTKTQAQSQRTGNERSQTNGTNGTGRRTVQPGARVLEAYAARDPRNTAPKGNALSQEMARDIIIAAALKTSERRSWM